MAYRTNGNKKWTKNEWAFWKEVTSIADQNQTNSKVEVMRVDQHLLEQSSRKKIIKLNI